MNHHKQLRSYMILAVILSAALLTVLLSVARSSATKAPDVFFREAAVINPEQTVGRLFAAGADVTVAGQVTKGIIIVDGNLTVTPSAHIRETIVVIGGTAEFAPTAKADSYIGIIPPQGFSFVPLMVACISTAGIVSLLLFPLLAWVIYRWFTTTRYYNFVRDYFLEIQHHWPALYIGGSLLGSIFMLVIFIELAWETVFQKTTAFFDNVMFWLVRYFSTPTVDQIMIIITDLGFGSTYFLLITAVLFLLVYRRRWLALRTLIICLAGGVVLNYVLKNLFERVRPDFLRVVDAAGYSFPSGHAMVSLCFYGMVGFLAARSLKRGSQRLAVLITVSLLVAAIGISRIYLGVHYASDVVAGYAAGFMWLTLCISLLIWWEKAAKRD